MLVYRRETAVKKDINYNNTKLIKYITTVWYQAELYSC